MFSPHTRGCPTFQEYKIVRISENKKKSSPVGVVIILLLAVLACVCLFYAFRDLRQYKVARDEYDGLESMLADADQEQTSTGDSEGDAEHFYPLLNIDFASLYAMNPDFVGVIYIPVLDIKYPIVKGEDNEEYLHKTFEGTNVFSGCIFMDYRNDENFNDTFTFVYGHNMKDGSMFGNLKRFYREDGLCDQDPYVYIYTRDYVRKYKIFSYGIADVGTVDVFETSNDDTEYDSYINRLEKINLYHTTVDLSAHPDVLVLYTCHGSNNHTQKFLVHAAQVGKYRTTTNKKTTVFPRRRV